jgi:hypothetical protein
MISGILVQQSNANSIDFLNTSLDGRMMAPPSPLSCHLFFAHRIFDSRLLLQHQLPMKIASRLQLHRHRRNPSQGLLQLSTIRRTPASSPPASRAFRRRCLQLTSRHRCPGPETVRTVVVSIRRAPRNSGVFT